MLKITLIVLAVIAVGIVGILAYAATRPDDFRVQRSAVIKAPPEKIFPFINDFRQLARLVALREERSGDETDLRCDHRRQGRDLRLGGQQQCRVGQHGDPQRAGAVAGGPSSSIS